MSDSLIQSPPARPTTSTSTAITPKTGEEAAPIAVATRGGMLCALASRSFRAGEKIIDLWGELRDRPSWTSVQIGPESHLDVPEHFDLEMTIERCPWRFLNHACEPVAAFDGTRLIALRDIAAGAEITFHYASTEYRVDAPFDCGCGSSRCLGRIVGFAGLDPAQRARLEADLAPRARVQPHVHAAAARELAGDTSAQRPDAS